MVRLVYFNGDLIPETEAKLSIYDSALMFGDMVFEMTRSFNKKQFKLDGHLERLYASIKYVKIPLQMTIEEMKKAISLTIETNASCFNEDDEHRLMINVSRGILSLYKDVMGSDGQPNVIIADFPLRWTVAGMGKLFDTGINAVIPSQRQIPASLLEPKVKNRSRMHYMMANIEVSQYSGDNNWALLLDPDGFITEGTGCNFFIVKDNIVITPEPRNILRGISRQFVLDLCRKWGIDCIEKNIEPYDVILADEAFVTGTPFCMLPVTSLNNNTIGSGKPGETTAYLLEKWSEEVGVNIPEQIKKWNSQQKDHNGITPYKFENQKHA
jgi:branched-chain amino acid aminotransferase